MYKVYQYEYITNWKVLGVFNEPFKTTGAIILELLWPVLWLDKIIHCFVLQYPIGH